MSKKHRDKPTETLAIEHEEVSGEQDSNLLKWGLPALAGLGVFLIYLRTLAPSIVGGDTGELVTVAYKLGVAHPPGYPLFTMLAKLFTFIPFGTVAWRVNLLSAACDTIAAVIILLAVGRWARNRWAGLLAAGLFAFSPLVWRYAVVAEVFALNNLIVSIMLYLAVRYSEARERKFAYLSALVFGLGMANHHTCLFYGFPLMVWILLTGRAQLWTVRRLSILGGCFIAGLLPYVYLPLADARVPAVSWGHTSTVQGFLVHVLRREYGTLQLAAGKFGSGGNFFLRLSKYFSALPREVSYVGLVLAVIGLYHTLRRKGTASLAMTTLVAFCFYVIVFHALANLPLDSQLFVEIQMRFWQQANLMICVWAGLGFGALALLIPQSRTRPLEIAAVALVIVLAQAATNFRAQDQHLNTLVSNYARELLRPLPSNSLLWAKGDLVAFPAYYLQQCEGYRTDVRVIHREMGQGSWMKRLVNINYPDVSIPGRFHGPPELGGYNLKQLFDANTNHFKMFINNPNEEADTSWNRDYELWPFGMVNTIVSTHATLDPHAYVMESEKALPQFDLGSRDMNSVDSWERAALKDYWEARLNRSNFLINFAIGHENDRYMLEASAAGLEEVVARLPGAQPWVFKNLGLAYSKLAVYEPAYRLKMKAAWQRYLDSGPPTDDPDLIDIRKAISN